jgi:hypothetical protein
MYSVDNYAQLDICIHTCNVRITIAHAVQRLAACWTVRGSNAARGDVFPAVQTGHKAHPASCTMATGSFPRVKRPDSGADRPTPYNAGLRMGWSYNFAYPLCLHNHVT